KRSRGKAGCAAPTPGHWLGLSEPARRRNTKGGPRAALLVLTTKWRLVSQGAKFLVVDQPVNRRMIAAHRAIGIAPKLECVDLHGERVEMEQAPNEGVALAEDDLDRFERF